MIPLVRPVFPPLEDIQKIFQPALLSGQISNFGPVYDQLIHRLKKRTACFTLPVATGTAAIQIAVQTLFRKGSQIAVPDYTHIGTLQAIVAAHCVPILFPVSRHEWTLEKKVLEENAGRIHGCIVVSPFGYSVNTQKFDELCEKLSLNVIYDFAGGWGLDPHTENPVCYSLHGTKNFSCGEGGLISFKRRSQFTRAQRLINFDTLPDRQIASAYGSNLKLDELKCAVALAHLIQEEKIFDRINRKRSLLEFYCRELEVNMNTKLFESGSPSLCVIPVNRASMIEKKSKNQGFICKRYYPLLTQMTGLQSIARVGMSPSYFDECLALPSDVTDAEALTVVRAIKRLLKG